ncbi:hypothetical protein CAPTEDRAFT_209793 [Capitella teleta]|uniref:Uncharacterized protein n=1 Tax=Capitella teleta TaxID=283909 RepID=R7T402_CAPTE|nr:hypothetical protein CAPTEDRAFT_209793 [Capitella teleta]|eukprot:ELT87592.1 hypothetical protein CAPTEDRAFT_209793 [Capitella teleta]
MELKFWIFFGIIAWNCLIVLTNDGDETDDQRNDIAVLQKLITKYITNDDAASWEVLLSMLLVPVNTASSTQPGPRRVRREEANEVTNTESPVGPPGRFTPPGQVTLPGPPGRFTRPGPPGRFTRPGPPGRFTTPDPSEQFLSPRSTLLQRSFITNFPANDPIPSPAGRFAFGRFESIELLIRRLFGSRNSRQRRSVKKAMINNRGPPGQYGGQGQKGFKGDKGVKGPQGLKGEVGNAAPRSLLLKGGETIQEASYIQRMKSVFSVFFSVNFALLVLCSVVFIIFSRNRKSSAANTAKLVPMGIKIAVKLNTAYILCTEANMNTI